MFFVRMLTNVLICIQCAHVFAGEFPDFTDKHDLPADSCGRLDLGVVRDEVWEILKDANDFFHLWTRSEHAYRGSRRFRRTVDGKIPVNYVVIDPVNVSEESARSLRNRMRWVIGRAARYVPIPRFFGSDRAENLRREARTMVYAAAATGSTGVCVFGGLCYRLATSPMLNSIDFYGAFAAVTLVGILTMGFKSSVGKLLGAIKEAKQLENRDEWHKRYELNIEKIADAVVSAQAELEVDRTNSRDEAWIFVITQKSDENLPDQALGYMQAFKLAEALQERGFEDYDDDLVKD